MTSRHNGRPSYPLVVYPDENSVNKNEKQQLRDHFD